MISRHSISFITLLCVLWSLSLHGQHRSHVWSPDNGDGTYKNPIINADYSDPDICKVGNNFYMTSSSFNSVPALPILHSTDLVNWQIINHAIKSFPGDYYNIPQHGNGVWAPCLRYHKGMFYIYWGDPDQGIFMVQTDDPTKEWSAPILVKKAFGNIDPSPLWDDDGKVYMVHAFAHSRAGVKSLLQVVELSKDGSQIQDKGVIVFDGHKDHPTIEGPKFYKRNGYYYIFAPAGGVPTGWQLVLRSKDIYGPYEEKIVLAQGDTPINGPHQGGLVELDNGESWFVHFQDRYEYGRVVHLQPVEWVDDWPVIGNDKDEDGTGEPYLIYKKPSLPKSSINNPYDSDEFNLSSLGLQWQWNANPQPGWYNLNHRSGYLKLNSQKSPEGYSNLWMLPNVLLQKFPAQVFTNTVKMDISRLQDDEEAGLVVFGLDYASLALKVKEGTVTLLQKTCNEADNNNLEVIVEKQTLQSEKVWLRVKVKEGAIVNFHFSLDGKKFNKIGEEFKVREGKWVGAKTGLYAKKESSTGKPGFALFDWFRVEE
ncbi:MAG: glycoside hydrolase 43 family protein [Cyclobacteriaceae bacterium]